MTSTPDRTLPLSSDVAFSPSVKEQQRRLGSRGAYARMEARGGFSVEIDDALAEFIGRQRSFFLATASKDGQPYIQHRGGAPGFLRVLDARTLAFADYRGNRQYISLGNLAENPRVHLFLIDFAERSRIKIWGRARVVEGDAELVARVASPTEASRAERVILVEIEAWDANCAQHIPQRFEADDVARAIAERDAKIAALESEIARLRSSAKSPS